MRFPFNTTKAVEVGCRFLELDGGTINVMKLIKLIYLLDRRSIETRGIPVVGGDYLSMRNGPVTSEVLDLINAGRLGDGESCEWEKYISDRQSHEVSLEQTPRYENLAPAEMRLIDEIHGKHGKKDQWQLRDWCHEHCSEWTKLEDGAAPIFVQDIAQALGMTMEDTKEIELNARESHLITHFLVKG